MPVFKPCLLLFCLLYLCAPSAFSQNFCPFPGESAHSAIPICGTSVFSQNDAAQSCQYPFSYMNTCPNASTYKDYNSFWYKFTCYQGGTLGFTIIPNRATDDYDWAIFDITNHQPDDVYTLPGLVIACNWTGTRGNTGTSMAGVDMFTCYSPNAPAFGSMPTLVQGHEYLLMVCNFSLSSFGYDLSFSGGTAVITDAVLPAIASSWYDETNNIVGVKLNKKLLCKSISIDGSEFTITPGPVSIVSAEGINCNLQVDGDSILLQLSQPLPPGAYTVTINNGMDGNTLLDACQRQVPPGDVIHFTVSNMQLSSNQVNVSCHGGNDGSASVAPANGVSPYSYSWNTTPVQTGPAISGLAAGVYTCTVTDAANIKRQVQVTITEPVPLTAGETHTDLDCTAASMGTATVLPYGGTGPYQYNWISAGGQAAATATGLPAGTYTCIVEDQHHCRISVPVVIDSINFLPTADAGADIIVYDVSGVTLHGQPSGTGLWEQVSGPSTASFRDATTALTDAGQLQEGVYLFKWTSGNGVCSSSDTVKVTILKSPDMSCRFVVPNAFSPGSGGANGLFKPKRHCAGARYVFAVYNRWGERIFHTTNPAAGWNGLHKGFPQPGGVYAWTVTYTDMAGMPQVYKGTVLLVR